MVLVIFVCSLLILKTKPGLLLELFILDILKSPNIGTLKGAGKKHTYTSSNFSVYPNNYIFLPFNFGELSYFYSFSSSSSSFIYYLYSSFS